MKIKNKATEKKPKQNKIDWYFQMSICAKSKTEN
jgi:hypothetical protein